MLSSQVEVDDESKAIMAINIHIGMLQVNRLQQDVKTAPADFETFVGMILTKCLSQYSQLVAFCE